MSRLWSLRTIVVLVGLFILITLARWSFIEQMDALAFDFALRLRGVEDPDPRIKIVAIDDGSLSTVGSWPWSPEILDRLFKIVLEQRPQVLGIDLILSRSIDNYPAVKRNPRVVLATSLGKDEMAGGTGLFWQRPKDLGQPGPTLGHIHANKDPDGVCRSLPLAVSLQGVRRWAFSVEMARIYQDLDPSDVFFSSSYLEVGNVQIPRMATPIDEAVDARGVLPSLAGDHLLVNSRGGPGTFPYLPAGLILNSSPEMLRALTGAIVLVGATSYSLGDHLSTAFAGPSEMPGIEIHANALDTILNSRFVGALLEPARTILVLPLILLSWFLFTQWRISRTVAAFLIGGFISFTLPTLVLLSFSYWIPAVTVVVTVLLTGATAQFMHYTDLNKQLNARFKRLAGLVRETPSQERLLRPGFLFREKDIEWKTQVLGEVTEAALRANKEREEMISFVSHELKTPLTSIHGFADLLLTMENLPIADRREALDYIRFETNRLAEMVQDYLVLSRLESQGPGLELSEHSILEVLEKAAMLVAPQLRSKHMKILGISEILDLKVRLDLKLLTQVFLNLFSNAVKFSPENSVVRVSVTEENSWVNFCISDQGFGIAEGDLPKVFDKFFRGKVPSGEKVAGSGLGLAFVQEAVRRHHGIISVDSALGEGTCFTVRLPKEEAN